MGYRCSHAEVDRRLRGAYCLRHQYAPPKRRCNSTRLQGALSQKAVIFILAAVVTQNLVHYRVHKSSRISRVGMRI
jgi:hypothetical protein